MSKMTYEEFTRTLLIRDADGTPRPFVLNAQQKAILEEMEKHPREPLFFKLRSGYAEYERALAIWREMYGR